jgi:hypothetical protein
VLMRRLREVRGYGVQVYNGTVCKSILMLGEADTNKHSQSKSALTFESTIKGPAPTQQEVC